MAEATYAGKLGALARFIAALIANASELVHLDGIRARIHEISASPCRVFETVASERDGRARHPCRRVILSAAKDLGGGPSRKHDRNGLAASLPPDPSLRSG